MGIRRLRLNGTCSPRAERFLRLGGHTKSGGCSCDYRGDQPGRIGTIRRGGSVRSMADSCKAKFSTYTDTKQLLLFDLAVLVLVNLVDELSTPVGAHYVSIYLVSIALCAGNSNIDSRSMIIACRA